MIGKQKTAIVLGATGLTGGYLVRILLADPRYGCIKLYSRNAIGFNHPKLEEHLIDLFELENFEEAFRGDEVYCCIGTTRAKTPKKKLYRKIDYGIPVAAARITKQNGIGTFLVVSSMGANPRSRLFYNRTKGEMESEVLRIAIPGTYILRPALLAGKRKEKRIGEWLARQFMNVLNLVLVGPLDKFRSIHPEELARTMVWLANNPYSGTRIRSDVIRNLAVKYKP